MSPETEHDEIPAPMAPPTAPGGRRWFQTVTEILFAFFCLELGLFLLIYPWSMAWPVNYFAWAIPGALHEQWRTLWNNPYVRGGVSGLGVINIWIALAEFRHLLISRRRPGAEHQQDAG